VNSMR